MYRSWIIWIRPRKTDEPLFSSQVFDCESDKSLVTPHRSPAGAAGSVAMDELTRESLIESHEGSIAWNGVLEILKSVLSFFGEGDRSSKFLGFAPE
jgi:hypothetical protein